MPWWRMLKWVSGVVLTSLWAAALRQHPPALLCHAFRRCTLCTLCVRQGRQACWRSGLPCSAHAPALWNYNSHAEGSRGTQRKEGAIVFAGIAGSNLQATTCAPYPQPKALGAALLDAQLSLLGTLLAAVSAPNQAAIVEALLSIAEGGPQVWPGACRAYRCTVAVCGVSESLGLL